MKASPRILSSRGARWRSTGGPVTAMRARHWRIPKFFSFRIGSKGGARSITARFGAEIKMTERLDVLLYFGEGNALKESDVRARAFAMPLTSPAFPPGPYRFRQREYLIIAYRTDPDKLRALVPEPLEVDEPVVKYEFIRMPDSTGFGDYTETGQVIPVSFRGRKGGYSHCMFLNDDPPIAGGRELWGFPKKLAQPSLRAEIDTLVGTLDYGPVRVATGTMGYKHKATAHAVIKATLEAPNFLLKIIPHVDGSPRICELVEYYLEDIDPKGAWTGPGALDLHAHALAPVAELPVLEIKQMPEELRESADAKLLLAEADDKVCNIVHLIYRARPYEGIAKDFEFSRRTMEEHWRAGYSNDCQTLRNPQVLHLPDRLEGVRTFDHGEFRR